MNMKCYSYQTHTCLYWIVSSQNFRIDVDIQKLKINQIEVAHGNGSVRKEMLARHMKWLTLHAVNHRLKDGSPATEKSARYLVHGYSLIIKDVTTEDAGDYTILLGIKQSNVFKNLTATLIVNGKFTFQTSFGLWEGENWWKIVNSKGSITLSKKTEF